MKIIANKEELGKYYIGISVDTREMNDGIKDAVDQIQASAQKMTASLQAAMSNIENITKTIGKSMQNMSQLAVQAAGGITSATDVIRGNIKQVGSEVTDTFDKITVRMDKATEKIAATAASAKVSEAKGGNKKEGAPEKDAKADKNYLTMFKDIAKDIEKFKSGNASLAATIANSMSTAVKYTLDYEKVIAGVAQITGSTETETRKTATATAMLTGAFVALTGGSATMINVMKAVGGPFEEVATKIASIPELCTFVAPGIQFLGKAVINIFTAMLSPVETFKTAVAAIETVITVVRTVVGTFVAAIELLPEALALGSAGMSAWAEVCGISGIATAALETILSGLYLLVGAGVAVIAGLALAWYFNLGGLREATAESVNMITDGFKTLWENIKNIFSGIGNIFKGLWTILTSNSQAEVDAGVAQIRQGLDGIKQAYAGAKEGLTKVIQGGKGFGFTAFNLAHDQFFGKSGEGEQPKIPGVPVGGYTGAGGKAEETAFQAAKRRYQEEIAMAEYSAAQKEAIYKKHLENVNKGERETTEYKLECIRLTRETTLEALAKEELDLKIAVASNQKTEAEEHEARVVLKRKALEAELKYQVDSRMAIEDTKTADIRSTREKIEEEVKASKQYKELLLGLKEEEKSFAAYRLQLAKEALAHQAELQKMELEMAKETLAHKAEMRKMDGDTEGEKDSFLHGLGLIDDGTEMQRRHQRNREERIAKMKEAERELGDIDSEISKLPKETNSEKEKQALEKRTQELAGRRQKAEHQKEKVEKDNQRETQKENIEKFNHDNKWKIDALDSMRGAMKNATKELLKGTMTWKQAFRSVGQAIKESILDSISQMITKIIMARITAMVLGKALKNVGTEVGAAGGGSAATMVAANGLAFGATLGMLTAMAGAIATILPAGPGLAAKMTAGIGSASGTLATATAGAITGINALYVKSGAGGWKVPYDQLMKVHEDEVILPARLTRGFENIIATNSGGGNQPAFTPSINVYASSIDGRGMKKALQGASKDLVDILRKEYRSFNFATR